MDRRDHRIGIKESIENFFQSLDPEFRPKKKAIPLSLKAKALEKIKEIRENKGEEITDSDLVKLTMEAM